MQILMDLVKNQGLAKIPLDGLQGRTFPHINLQVGTGSKQDFLTS